MPGRIELPVAEMKKVLEDLVGEENQSLVWGLSLKCLLDRQVEMCGTLLAIKSAAHGAEQVGCPPLRDRVSIPLTSPRWRALSNSVSSECLVLKHLKRNI